MVGDAWPRGTRGTCPPNTSRVMEIVEVWGNGKRSPMGRFGGRCSGCSSLWIHISLLCAWHLQSDKRM